MRKLFVVTCAAALLASVCASAQKYNITIAGASPKGVWSILGVALDKAMSAAYPGSSVTYQTSGGGIANIALVDRKKVALALASTGEMHLGANAIKPFKKKIDSVRVVARVHAWLYFHPMLTKKFADKYGIKDFSDIAKKKPPMRISINRRGLLVSVIAEAMFKEIGVSLKDIESWGGKVIYAASGDSTSLMADRKLDGHMMTWPIKHRRLRQMEAAVPMVLLSIKDRSISERVAKKLNMALDTLPGGTYKSQLSDLFVPSMEGNIIMHKNGDDKMAYDIAKAVHSNLKAFSSAHRFLAGLTPKFLVGSKGQYHPGAIKYYKEAGLM